MRLLLFVYLLLMGAGIWAQEDQSSLLQVQTEAGGQLDGAEGILDEAAEADTGEGEDVIGGNTEWKEVEGPKTVALLVTGHVRTFNRTVCSLHHNVLEPLLEAGYTVHIFAVVPKDSMAEHMERMRLIPSVQVHLTYISEVTHPENCTTYVMENYHQISLQWWGKDRYAKLFLDQLYFKWRADEERKEFEKSSGMTFTWVIWLRPDVLYIDKFPSLNTLNPGAISVPPWGGDFKGINDRAMATTRTFSSAYLSLYKGLCVDNAEFPTNYQSERIHRWYVRRASDPAASISWLENFRFLRLRIKEQLPVEQETPSYFDPDLHKRCANYRTIKETWWIRALQLQCDAPAMSQGILQRVANRVIEVPDCMVLANRRPVNIGDEEIEDGEHEEEGGEEAAHTFVPSFKPRLKPPKPPRPRGVARGVRYVTRRGVGR
mmetsp:Transcript_101404/g.175126  ORF Transcript_101404/g.175126 Transcript_101404/m.175126 type:complete len:432 (-) Transcript_101404:239-1534(-)